MLKSAKLQNWVDTNALAWRWLCKGEEGVSVNPNEAWASAISRVAATILADSGFGLAKPYDADQWDEVSRVFANRASCALDGRVQGPLGRIDASSLPPEPPRGPTAQELLEVEWEKVQVIE